MNTFMLFLLRMLNFANNTKSNKYAPKNNISAKDD